MPPRHAAGLTCARILVRIDEPRLAGLLDGLRAVRAARAEIEQDHGHVTPALVRAHTPKPGANA